LILMNPGPVNLSARVRRALAGEDLCHREPEFTELQAAVRSRLLAVYGLDAATFAPVILGGSGTLAVEAMLASLVPSTGRLLVLENGVYGERMSEIARRHGIAVTPLHCAAGAEIPIDAVRRALASGDGFTHVAVVHHETTTGRLNALAPLGALCRERGAALLVDAVSSYGAEPLDLDGWGISACAATAHKCLHGALGISFVVVRRDALEPGAEPARSLYLDLRTWAREQERGGTPFTPIVPAFHALREALDELTEAGGWRARGARYRELAERIRAGLAELGIAPWLAPGDSSAVLRSYQLPSQMTYDSLHDELKKRGFVIYAGQPPLREQLFRISTMGEISDRDIDQFLAAFREAACMPQRKLRS
jgi:2-aminoethylphosphonate-pyruvate transaminase